ncbi:MAG: hypothetical protein NC311_08825 [Muribaculaceae bacterium]|nr:hypothetical protein [Muribaculaceae bacterium]MCM1399932.1 hypothetical protein [Clostridium sp.]MCM1460734.1 hypothetical protein [Bacteroides sp.]
MQLKAVGESLNVLNSIENVLNNFSDSGRIVVLQELKRATKGYSLEAVKAAIAQSKLNEEQIKNILIGQGLEGQFLETTTAELAQITTNNALTASQEATTASTLGLGNAFKGLWATIKKHPIIAGVTAIIGIGTVISSIYNKHQEKITETLKKSTELTSTYKQEKSELDSLIEKYKDLNEQLTNAFLTTEEYNSIKEQLSSLQEDLISKYGKEASAIDIVNGKYDEQIKKLDTISRKKAQDFVNENSSNIKEDWNFLNDTKSITKQRRTTNGNEEIYNKYLQGLNGIDAIHDYNSNYSGNGVYLNYKYEGTAEEIRKQINADINALRKQYGDSNEYVNVVLDDLSELLKNEKISSEQINQSIQNMSEYAISSVNGNSEIQSAYDSLVDGIEKYNNALETGEGIDKAYSNYEKLRDEFKNVSADILGIEYVYGDLLNKINEPLDLSFKLDTNINNGNKNTERYLNKLQDITSDQLRSLNYDDLLSVNSLNNYKDAFGHLIKQLDVSEAGVDALIDRLIELGYITNSADIQNKENILNALGFNKNASNATAAKRNITANNVYNSLTDEQKHILGGNLDLIPQESYNWTERQWMDFIEKLNNNAEVDITVNPAKSLDSIKDAFSGFESIYEDIHNGTTVAAD